MYFDGEVQVEEEDQCMTCEHFMKSIACPLLEALGVGIAHLEGDVLVKNCGFYVPYVRHLRIVRSDDIQH